MDSSLTPLSHIPHVQSQGTARSPSSQWILPGPEHISPPPVVPPPSGLHELERGPCHGCFYPRTPCPPSAFHPAPALILSCHLLKTLQQLLVTPSKRHSPQGPTSLCVTSPPLPDLSPGPTSPGALVTHSPEHLSVSPPPGLSHTCSSLCPEGPSPQGPHGLCFPSSQSPMDRV